MISADFGTLLSATERHSPALPADPGVDIPRSRGIGLKGDAAKLREIGRSQISFATRAGELLGVASHKGAYDESA
jgi:hypothetical protein